MGEKTTCRRYCSYNLQHLDRIETFLEQMAGEGWMVYKHYGGWFSFRKEKPQNIRYYVEVFEKERWNNSFENRVNQAYIQSCGKMGWKFVDSDSRFQIMCCSNPSAKKPKLLQTGKIDSIYKLCFKEYFYILLCMLFMALFNMFFSFNGIVAMLSSLSQLLYVSAWAVVSCYLACYMVSQMAWHKKALACAGRRKEIPDNPRHKFVYIALLVALIMLALSIVGFFVESHTYSSGDAFRRCLIMLAAVAIGILFLACRDRKKSWKVRIGGTAVILAACASVYMAAEHGSSIFGEVHKTKAYGTSMIYEDSLPITLESLGVGKAKEAVYTNYHEVDGEFIIKQDYYSEVPADASISGSPSLCYTVYRTKNSILYDRVLSEACFRKDGKSSYEQMKESGSLANAIYKKKLQTGYYEYIFAFDGQIIKMNISVELNGEQLQKMKAI